ncbi:hypothetical protein [Brevundimonas sp. GCM10030266]|uniref:hypothetical protein n=1 Tax=Brevundimonas sp. GCM10030266 TaxID=3273386 RepID=UPI0036079667
MVDGALTLQLDPETARRLADAAREAGVTPEAYVADRLSEALSLESPLPLEEALSEFRNHVETKLAAGG